MLLSDFPIDNTKNCIIETERQLRDVVSTILSQKYGPAWYKSHGFSREELDNLEQCRNDEQKKFPHQKVSDRILDYSYIIDLKKILENNWELFKHVFHSKNRTMVLLDSLQDIRNPELHGRPVLLPHQHHLCLGICGELILAVENWRKGFAHTIKTYCCYLRFTVYLETDTEEGAQIKAGELAQNWLDNAVKTLSGKLEMKLQNEHERQWLLKLSNGHVKVSMTSHYRGNDGRYFRGADINLETSSIKALDSLIATGGHPYWGLHLNLSEDIDVAIIVSNAKQYAGSTPSSSTEYKIGDGALTLTDAEFNVGVVDDASIRFSFLRGQADSGGRISLFCDGKTGSGFYRAHAVFPVNTIMSIIYGEMSPATLQELFRAAITR